MRPFGRLLARAAAAGILRSALPSGGAALSLVAAGCGAAGTKAAAGPTEMPEYPPEGERTPRSVAVTASRAVAPRVASAPKPSGCCSAKNDCKGKGNCKTARNACKGLNTCKGQGGCKPPRCP